jgi:hypothetical protein
MVGLAGGVGAIFLDSPLLQNRRFFFMKLFTIYASGEKKLVQHWCAVLMETGEERLLCYRCQQTHFSSADLSR